MSNPDQQVKHIVCDYVFRNKPPSTAIEELQYIDRQRDGNSSAVLGIAEINLQEATEHDTANGRLYHAAGAGYLALQERVSLPDTFKAQFRLAQLPLYRRIYGKDEMPDRLLAQKVHTNTLETAFRLATLLRVRTESSLTSAQRCDGSGLLAEILVVGLFQYYALSAEITDCFFPTQALLKEDMGEPLMYKTQLRTGRDVNIFVPDDNDKPQITYSVQTKKKDDLNMLYLSSIAKIVVDTDLKLNGKVNPTHEIIDDFERIKSPNRYSAVARARLQERATIIIDKLEA